MSNEVEDLKDIPNPAFAEKEDNAPVLEPEKEETGDITPPWSVEDPNKPILEPEKVESTPSEATTPDASEELDNITSQLNKMNATESFGNVPSPSEAKPVTQSAPTLGIPSNIAQTSVENTLPEGYKNQLEQINISKANAAQQYAGELAKIYGSGGSPQGMAVAKARLDAQFAQYNAVVEAHSDGIGQSVYQTLSPTMQAKADSIVQQHGLGYMEAVPMVKEDASNSVMANGLMNLYANDPAKLAQVQNQLFGAEVKDPNSGQVTRVGGLLQRNQFGTLTTTDGGEALGRLYSQAYQDQDTSNMSNSAVRQTTALNTLRSVYQTKFNAAKALLEADPNSQDAKDQLQVATNQLESVGSNTINLLTGQPMSFSSDDQVKQKLQQTQAQNDIKTQYDTLNAGAQKAMVGQNPTQQAASRNSYYQAQAEKNNLPIIDPTDPSSILSARPGLALQKDAQGNLTPVNHDPVTWANNTMAQVNATGGIPKLQNQLQALQSSIPAARDRLISDQPNIKFNTDGTAIPDPRYNGSASTLSDYNALASRFALANKRATIINSAKNFLASQSK